MRWVALAVATASVSSSKVTPTQKVIELLNGIKEKGEKEKHEERVQFATYSTWCENVIAEKQTAIKENNQVIDSLTAAIAKGKSDARKLGQQIAEHDEDISVWEGDKVAAQKVRDIENADYEKTHTDYSESLSALERAIAVLQKENYDRAQAPPKEALIQLASMALIDSTSRDVINAFLQQAEAVDEDPDAKHLAVTAPPAHGYQNQSSGVIDLLKKLKTKFDGERNDLIAKERKDKEAFDLLMQSLNSQIEEATRQRDTKNESRATKLQKAGDNEGALADSVATRDDDQEFLTETTGTCNKKAQEFNQRQQLRADELVAIAKAVEILSSTQVKGHAEKHLPQDVAVSLLQLLRSVHSHSSGESSLQPRVAAYLREEGKRLNSRVLSTLAMRAGDDPLRKVKQLIKDLIVKLMEEATAETEKQGWCNTELTGNEHMRTQKSDKVLMLHATIDQLKTSVAKLTEEISELTQQVADLDRAVAEAKNIRAKEKAENDVTIKDAKEGQEAVARALDVLQEFYTRAAEATALSQVDAQPEAPEIFDSPYKGQQAENGGVVGMLEVIQGDFARLEAQTKADDTESQKLHQKFLDESEIDKAQKTKDIEHMTASKEDQSQILKESESDVIGTQKELDAANAYYEELKGQCISSGANYEDRAARRNEEIESLQEALRILKSEDLE